MILSTLEEFEKKKNEQAVGRRLICVRPLEGYTTYLGIYKIEKYLEDTRRFVITDDQDKECHVRADRFVHVEQFGWWIRNHPIDEVQTMIFVNLAVHLLEQRDKQRGVISIPADKGMLQRFEEVKKLAELGHVQLPDNSKCTCPAPKNDGSPFDGVSYHCPIHGR